MILLYVTTRARIKPGKHLCMGLALKSMTGSQKVVEILNRFGHSVGYHTKDERVAEEFANRLSGDLGRLGALGKP